MFVWQYLCGLAHTYIYIHIIRMSSSYSPTSHNIIIIMVFLYAYIYMRYSDMKTIEPIICYTNTLLLLNLATTIWKQKMVKRRVFAYTKSKRYKLVVFSFRLINRLVGNIHWRRHVIRLFGRLYRYYMMYRMWVRLVYL